MDSRGNTEADKRFTLLKVSNDIATWRRGENRLTWQSKKPFFYTVEEVRCPIVRD